MLWQLTPGHDLALRAWGDECVVHHRASNDTLRVPAWVGALLLALADEGPHSAAQLAAKWPDGDEAEVTEALQALALRDVVEPAE